MTTLHVVPSGEEHQIGDLILPLCPCLPDFEIIGRNGVIVVHRVQHPRKKPNAPPLDDAWDVFFGF